MECETASTACIAERVGRAITELKALQEPLLAGEVDAETLTDFRDALNRVRNTAWAAQQSAAAPLTEGKTTVASLLASERIRAAYQLCRAICEDVRREDVALQKGNLLELYGVAEQLVDELKASLAPI